MRTLCAGATSIAAPAAAWAQIIPVPIQPKIQRKAPTLLLGYFGDSTTRGAWANNNPFPDNYSYKNLTSLIESALSPDFGPVSVYQQGNDGESAYSLLNGGYIPNAGITASPFATRLSESPYDAVIVGVGICDAIAARSPALFQTLLDGLSAAAQDAEIPLFFETPNPITRSVAYSAALESYRPCFSAYDLLVDQNYVMDMSDDFHPTPAAYDLKVLHVADALRNRMIRRFSMIYL